MTAALVTLFTCFVTMGYTAVRLGNHMPMNTTLICIAFIFFFFVFLDTMLPLAVGGSARSEEFVRHWEMQNLPKLVRKELKSCSILRVRIGPYATLTKGFRTNFFSFVLSNTVDLMIMW